MKKGNACHSTAAQSSPEGELTNRNNYPENPVFSNPVSENFPIAPGGRPFRAEPGSEGLDASPIPCRESARAN
ncbi:MAG: hypothetical protein ACRC8Y_22225 [Chroococcales cyanobacterium]